MNSLKPAVVGFALAVVVCFITSQLEPRRGLDVLVGGLVATAAVYVGSALPDERDGSRVTMIGKRGRTGRFPVY